MRRIDAIALTLLILLSGGLIYLLFRGIGVDNLTAGIWSQALLIGGLMVWLGTYVFRAATKGMTLNTQIQNYKEAVLRKRLEELTPEELAQLQAEIAAEEGEQGTGNGE
ncbi:DUF3007 family protein [Spirulina sp. CCNP1310]|uniref:DUF3007 family protein n=1 Tax=Spirulina sp. CCNP1310 TaxID=3110249 RepID=UPI002B221709|nr:DUF3007 family protein [Spirulina sp. CCNP1310]MEA5420844.1 DUF3007 family protein [Spirulina sp. CCNP1310]